MVVLVAVIIQVLTIALVVAGKLEYAIEIILLVIILSVADAVSFCPKSNQRVEDGDRSKAVSRYSKLISTENNH